MSLKKIFLWDDAYPQGGSGGGAVRQMIRRMGSVVRIPRFHGLSMWS